MIPRLPPGLVCPMVVGQGAFSSVLRARQRHLDRHVAVKILEEPDAVRRREWMREAKTLAQLRLDCVPAVYDAVESGPNVFIIMQWLRGLSLRALLEQDLETPERNAVASSLCAALAVLHAAGYAHRDLKPENVLLCPRPGGQVFLVDFGFASPLPPASHRGVQGGEGWVKGTPAYMAPESWRNGGLDFLKSDLFALGRILREIDPGPEWEAFIAPLLAENPDQRPASAFAWWRQWEKDLPKGSLDWKGRVDSTVAQIMERSLRAGAENLLAANRHEEAYWLLAESLEENPDSAESLRLMQALPGLQGRKTARRRLAALASAAAMILALGAAFYFGRTSGRGGMVSIPETGEGEYFLSPSPRSERFLFGAFKPKDAASESRLSGVLRIEGADACGQLYLDGQPAPVGVRDGLALPHGEHELECRDESGLREREKFGILPFQRKSLRFPRGKKA